MDKETECIWISYPEFRYLFGSMEALSLWLDQPGSVYEAQCVRRKPDGEWVLGVGFSISGTRRKLIRCEGLILVERELQILELTLLNQKRAGQFPRQATE